MENKEKRVGLCLAYNGTNYGQLLQAYATQYTIEKMGFSTEIIAYHSGKNKGIKLSYAAIVVALKKINNKIKQKCKKIVKCDVDEIHKKNAEGRKKTSDLFRKKKLHNIVKINGIDNLKNHAKCYDAVLVGSDQIWLPDVSVTNFYTLRFVPKEVNRISYATSLGVSEYPNYAKKPAAEFLENINYLSVREQQGKDLIENISNAKAKVVLDPTYLLTKEEWLNNIPLKEIIEPGYILCYFLSDNKEQRKFAKKFAENKKLKLVGILSDESKFNDYDLYDEIIIGKGPEEFVNLIRNSEYVLTDSFHGMAFSILNEKQFNIFYRVREDTKLSRNSRIDNVLRMFNLEDRLILSPETTIGSNDVIDYNRVNKIIEKKRNESLKFLENALFDKGE